MVRYCRPSVHFWEIAALVSTALESSALESSALASTALVSGSRNQLSKSIK